MATKKKHPTPKAKTRAPIKRTAAKAKSAPAKKKKTIVPTKKPAKTTAKKSAKIQSASTAKKPVKAANAAKPEKAAKTATKNDKAVKLSPFHQGQRERLLALKDTLLDSMNGVAKDSLRSRADGSEASAFGMHQADAGSDAYDRDFALSLLSQEQDSLYEIDEALKRIENGTYGVCEISGKPIPHPRLEALPFTRYTVECQAELEKRNRYQRVRQPVTSLFGLGEDDGDGEDDDSSSDAKD